MTDIKAIFDLDDDKTVEVYASFSSSPYGERYTSYGWTPADEPEIIFESAHLLDENNKVIKIFTEKQFLEEYGSFQDLDYKEN